METEQIPIWILSLTRFCKIILDFDVFISQKIDLNTEEDLTKNVRRTLESLLNNDSLKNKVKKNIRLRKQGLHFKSKEQHSEEEELIASIKKNENILSFNQKGLNRKKVFFTAANELLEVNQAVTAKIKENVKKIVDLSKKEYVKKGDFILGKPKTKRNKDSMLFMFENASLPKIKKGKRSAINLQLALGSFLSTEESNYVNTNYSSKIDLFSTQIAMFCKVERPLKVKTGPFTLSQITSKKSIQSKEPLTLRRNVKKKIDLKSNYYNNKSVLEVIKRPLRKIKRPHLFDSTEETALLMVN